MPENCMNRYLSLLGLLFLGLGALAIASTAKAATEEPKSLPNDESPKAANGRLALPSVPSFHARFSIN
jgi:hypothetical protein